MSDTMRMKTIPVVERTFEHSADFMEQWGRTIHPKGMTLPIFKKQLDPESPLEMLLKLANGRPIIEGRVLVDSCSDAGIAVRFVKMTERANINIELASEYNAS